MLSLLSNYGASTAQTTLHMNTREWHSVRIKPNQKHKKSNLMPWVVDEHLKHQGRSVELNDAALSNTKLRMMPRLTELVIV